MVALSKCITSELIAFLDTDQRNDTIEALIERAAAAKKVGDLAGFRQAIHRREEVVSTGIGMGVAIPHAKVDTCPDFFIAIGILSKGVAWESLDQQPVRLVFLIGGPDDKPTEYLQLLSHLTMLMKDEEQRKQLLQLKTAEQVVDFFTEKELSD